MLTHFLKLLMLIEIKKSLFKTWKIFVYVILPEQLLEFLTNSVNKEAHKDFEAIK
jgi:hypothetical protein